MTTKESAQILAILTAAYPNSYKNLSKEEAAAVALVWAAQFADVSYDIVFMALQKAISTCKFPPSICEVKDKIKSLYWDAYTEIQNHKMGLDERTEEEMAEYKRIYDSTQQYRYRENGPTLPAMLPHSRRALTTGG